MKYGKAETRQRSRFLAEIPESARREEARTGFHLVDEAESASLSELFARVMGEEPGRAGS
jgi:hypothetical protein